MNTASFTRPPLALALACLLATTLPACQSDTQSPPAAGHPETSTIPAPAEAPKVAARAASGLDLAGMDHGVSAGDDFYTYANGNWQKSAQIPADRASTGVFLEVFLTAENRLADLVRSLPDTQPAAGSDARRIVDFNTAFMDEEGIEARGLAPLQDALDAVDAIKDLASLSRHLGAGLRADVDPINATNYHTSNLFGLFVAAGLDDHSRNIGYLLQGGLGMPERDYYLSDDVQMRSHRAAYETYIAALLSQAGTKDAQTRAAGILALETKIARAQATIIDTQDIHKANNPWPTADFGRRAPGIDWPAFLEAAGLAGESTLVAWQPQAIASLSALVASEPLSAWKDYLRFHTLDHAAALLPRAYAELAFGFHGTELTGATEQRARWKRALGAANTALGDAIGQIYVERYFPASSKARVEAMVGNILAAFRDGVDKLDWMSPETRQVAREKAATMRVGVGYPERWRDYSTLDIRPDDALGNMLRAELAEYRHQLAKLGKAPDQGEWWMTPQTVNAVNLPLQNAMNFPAAILEAPFFDPAADDAVNYGAIGAVIGHEISHGFDNLGAEFDAQGRLRNWWTPEDAAHFKAAADRLAAQYSAYQALPGLFINGQQTLGENIADLAGLQAAHAAWRASLAGADAPVIDGLTGEERFFLAFAQAWRSKMRDTALRAQVIGNEHAPGQWRALTVRNLDAWYSAFDVKDGEALYLAPEDRVRIW